jgi:hypothetical protein
MRKMIIRIVGTKIETVDSQAPLNPFSQYPTNGPQEQKSHYGWPEEIARECHCLPLVNSAFSLAEHGLFH